MDTNAATSSAGGNGGGKSSPVLTPLIVSSAPAVIANHNHMLAPGEEEAVSYVNQDGEWKHRKINMFSLLRGFISQLKPGQDLTKVSLPAEVCTPYGLLEVMGSRELAMFHLCFGMNNHPESHVERFLAALRFFFGTVRSERFDKKPWNPVLGETHITWVDIIHNEDGSVHAEPAIVQNASPRSHKKSHSHQSSTSSNPGGSSTNHNNGSLSPHAAAANHSRSTFVGEQVSHHPPISAFSLNNTQEDITCNANISFTVRFGGNQATVATAGALQLTSKRFNETYELTKCLPDMVVKNVIWGKKYIMWEGEVVMTCPTTGLTAYLKFKEKSHTNVVKGYVVQGDAEEPLIEINGVAGEKIMYHYSGRENDSRILLDLTKETLARIHYLPKSKLAPLSSVGVWSKVNEAIVDDNIPLADKEKKIIEQAQRERAKARAEAGQEYTGLYFDMNAEGIWLYKNNMVLENAISGIGPSPTPPVVAVDQSPNSGSPSFQGEYEDVMDDEGVNSGIHSPTEVLSDFDRSPITSGDEHDDEADGEIGTQPGNNLEIPKRRRGSVTGVKLTSSASSSHVPSPQTKKELRAEKKKVREEVKRVYSTVKQEKKRAASAVAISVSMDNQVFAGWAKIRNSFKKWKDRWVVLQNGRLIYFKSPTDVAKDSCIGIILLNGCDVRPRPSKKEGACFKIYHLRQYPIYSKQGLKGETISSALLPVGSDYAILRCEDTKLNTWIEKIRLCIPDWDRNKALIKSAASEADSESDEDSEDSDAELSVAERTLSNVPSSSNIKEGSSAEGASTISNDQLLGQIGQLYKITRKLSQRHRKFAENMEEFRTKTVPESLADIKRTIQSNHVAASASIRKSPFNKSESKPQSIVGKLKSGLDLKTILLLVVILALAYLWLTAKWELSSVQNLSTIGEDIVNIAATNGTSSGQ